MKITLTTLTLSAPLFTGYGALTGTPSHGDGKHFTVEQELVAASSHAAVKEMGLFAPKGRKIALYASTMGDQGSGSITGRRYSIDVLICSGYQNNSDGATRYSCPTYDTTVTTRAGALSSITAFASLLNAPATVLTRSNGREGEWSAGLSVNGTDDYRNETPITNPRDVFFLADLAQTVLYLHGVEIVPPGYADTDVFIAVDVLGTARNRTELHICNAGTLKAQTKFEYFAANRNNRKLLIKLTSAAHGSQHKEKYALWTGPYKVSRAVKASDGPVVDFPNITPYGDTTTKNRPDFKQNNGKNLDVSDEVIHHREGE